MRKLWAGMLVLVLPLSLPGGQEPAKGPPAPAVSLLLKDRHGHVTPVRTGSTHTGGGIIDVQQPSPDSVVITMTGVAVATDHPCHGSAATLHYDLEQDFDVVFDKPEVKAAKLTIEARVIGLLRSGREGNAAEGGGCATVSCGGTGLVNVCVPDHGVAACESLSVNDRTGPVSVPVGSGAHTLHETWEVSATHPKALLGKAASAEFAPEPALDPQWISAREPFHGAPKREFGFQTVVRLAEDTPPEPAKEVNGKNGASR
jgi:hypothetical protein